MEPAAVAEVADLFLLHKAGGLDGAEYAAARDAALGGGAAVVGSGRGVAVGSGALQVYVRLPDGELRPVEVAADARGADLLAALGLPAGSPMQHHGTLLRAEVPLSDAGVCAEAVVELLPELQAKWESTTAHVTLSDTEHGAGHRAKLDRVRGIRAYDESDFAVIGAPTTASFEVEVERISGWLFFAGFLRADLDAVGGADSLLHQRPATGAYPGVVWRRNGSVIRDMTGEGEVMTSVGCSFGAGNVLSFIRMAQEVSLRLLDNKGGKTECCRVAVPAGQAVRPYVGFFRDNNKDSVILRPVTAVDASA